jgi:hypothetical protein
MDSPAPKLWWLCEIRLCEIHSALLIQMPLNAVEAGDKEEDDDDCHGH